jgi:hypothetical protein
MINDIDQVKLMLKISRDLMEQLRVVLSAQEKLILQILDRSKKTKVPLSKRSRRKTSD